MGFWHNGTDRRSAPSLFSCIHALSQSKAIASSTTLQPDEKVVCAYCADGQKIYLLVDTPEGQVLLLPQAQRISLTDAWDKGVEAQWLVGSDDGLLALSPDGHVAAFDLSGKLLWLDHYAGTIRGAMTTAGGEIRLLTQWETLTMLQLVDLANGRLMPVGVVPEAVCAHRLFPGDRWGYDLLHWTAKHSTVGTPAMICCIVSGRLLTWDWRPAASPGWHASGRIPWYCSMRQKALPWRGCFSGLHHQNPMHG